MLFLLFNPMVFFEEFFMQMMTGESVLGDSPFTTGDVGIITYALTQGKVWMFVSAGCILLLSVVFMMIAAWKVNPMHSASGKKPKKKKES